MSPERAEVYAKRRAAVDEAIRACGDSVGETGYAVAEAVLSMLRLHDHELGFDTRHFERAISEETDDIRARSRLDHRRAMSYSAAELEAKQRVGYWFARFVKDERCCSARDVLGLRAASVTTLACAELYRTATG